MSDMQARHIIEALRSGIPSRAVGQYFSEARPQLLERIRREMDRVQETGTSNGMIITGKYGEGKTHLLNTVFAMAQEENMVVSYLSLSKESPMDKLPLIYQKLIAGTYLPGREQPGFFHELDRFTSNSTMTNAMLAYAATELTTDKLYYLLRAYTGTDDSDEKYRLRADLEGDFAGNDVVKRIYRRVAGQPAKFRVNFTKTKHVTDYFRFMSRFFKGLGYSGWVILLDEAELIGRSGKKARLNAYRNMGYFLLPGKCRTAAGDEMPAPEGVYTVCAMSSSYVEDVIENKNEFANLEEVYPEGEREPMQTILNMIIRAPQLAPLSRAETEQILERVQELHGKAYDWTPAVSVQTLLKNARAGGYLLRTQIRAAIEFLDQLYQYGKAGKTIINELGRESFEEEPDVPALE